MSDIPPDHETIRVAASPSGIQRWIPGIGVARSYRLSYLRHDISAGLILTALLVPAGMGYAEASGLPAIHGLYATMVPLLVYALLGPSRIIILGPDSALAPLIAAIILPMAAGDGDRATALAAMLGILVGIVCMSAGIARFGFITELLSKPVRIGLLNGIALIILVSQLPKILGFSVDATDLAPRSGEIAAAIAAGEVNMVALLIGAISVAIIVACKAWAPRVPGTLVAVVLSTVAVGVWDLTGSGIAVVGEMPRGLPSFALPQVGWSDIGPLLVGALGISLVAFADTSVLSRTFAIRGGYQVDPNQEMIALGAANAATGFFQGFPISTSASRTPVAESAGARTQATGVIGAVAIAGLLIFSPGLLRNLPQAALGAVVVASALSLVEIRGVRKLYHERRAEFLLTLVSFFGVALFGVLIGIAVAVGLSLLIFIRRAWRPHEAVLGRVDGLKGYHDITRYPEARRIPGLIIYRFDAPLFFANAQLFGEQVRALVNAAKPPARWVIVSAEPITDVDTTAADMLRELDRELAAAGVELAFAELKDPVKDRLSRYGLTDTIGHRRFFPTLGVAIHTYVEETGVDWTDWQDAETDSSDTDRPA